MHRPTGLSKSAQTRRERARHQAVLKPQRLLMRQLKITAAEARQQLFETHADLESAMLQAYMSLYGTRSAAERPSEATAERPSTPSSPADVGQLDGWVSPEIGGEPSEETRTRDSVAPVSAPSTPSDIDIDIDIDDLAGERC
jgi:hypothetical protein